MNRRLLGSLSSLHFAPTSRAVSNLLQEGVPESQIHLTGNTVVEALHTILINSGSISPLVHLGRDRRMILLTAHRRENFGAPLQEICRAVQEVIERNRDVEVVYPVHLNPNVRNVVFKMLGGIPRIHLLEPLDYVNFVHLMRCSTLILTDSGGLQEEAPALGKPVLIVRGETERPEVLEAGVGELVGTNATAIVEATQRLLNDPEEYQRRAQVANPFGDGHASERIVQILVKSFDGDKTRACL
jgi:UDP-N-acetylglucosamine 2-epimerase (non-hydrolysing)